MKMVSTSSLISCFVAAILFPCPSWAMPKEVCQTACKNDGTCLENEPGSDEYHCECVYPMIGINCTAMLKEVCQTACKNDGTCLENKPGSDEYHCECVYPMTGTNCTEIDDEDNYNCFQNGSVVLCIFVKDLGTYDAVEKFCQSINMSMVVIPDKKTDESVNWIMRKNVANNFGACHFIGLKRDPKANSNFTWVDGSPLGNYNPMEIKEGQSLDCVCLDAMYKFRWINNDCNNSRHTEPDDYSLCARHYEP